MSDYIGDFPLAATFDTKFTTVTTTGAPTVLAGTPVISAYEDNDVTQITAGITLSVDFDSVVGLNNVRVVATGANGFEAGKNYQLVITTGTVGGTSVVGYVVGEFSIEARSALRPTTVGRTLDVSAGGEAGLDWANIGSPTTAQNLSATNIDVDQIVASVSGAVGSVTGLTASDVGAIKTKTDSLTFTVAGTVNAAVTHWVATAVATPTVNGVPEVDVTHWLGTAASVPTVAGVPNVNAKTWNDLTTVELPLVPTTAGRKLDVSAGGEAGLDWANIGSPTTAQNLSATNIDVDQVVASVSGAVGSVTGLTASDVGAIKTKTDFLPSVIAGGAGGVFIAGTNAATVVTTSFTTTFTGNLTGSVASVTGAVGSVTGNVGGNVTGTIGGLTAAALKDFFDTDSTTTYAGAVAGSVVKEIADNAGGTSLTVADIADGVWDEAVAGHVAAGSFGATDAAILAAVDTEVAAIKAKTDSLTFTVGGLIDANVLRFNGVALGAQNISKTTQAIGRGIVGVGSTFTSIVTSTFSPASVDADQFKGRIVTFDVDTTSAGLRGQATDITASTINAGLPVLTVTALTTAPVSTDSFSIT